MSMLEMSAIREISKPAASSSEKKDEAGPDGRHRATGQRTGNSAVDAIRCPPPRPDVPPDIAPNVRHKGETRQAERLSQVTIALRWLIRPWRGFSHSMPPCAKFAKKPGSPPFRSPNSATAGMSTSAPGALASASSRSSASTLLQYESGRIDNIAEEDAGSKLTNRAVVLLEDTPKRWPIVTRNKWRCRGVAVS